MSAKTPRESQASSHARSSTLSEISSPTSSSSSFEGSSRAASSKQAPVFPANSFKSDCVISIEYLGNPHAISSDPPLLELVQNRPGATPSTLFRGKVEINDVIAIAPLHVPTSFGFIMEIYLDGNHTKRYSSCCAYFLQANTVLVPGCLRVHNSVGGMPCFRCVGRKGYSAPDAESSLPSEPAPTLPNVAGYARYEGTHRPTSRSRDKASDLPTGHSMQSANFTVKPTRSMAPLSTPIVRSASPTKDKPKLQTGLSISSAIPKKQQVEQQFFGIMPSKDAGGQRVTRLVDLSTSLTAKVAASMPPADVFDGISSLQLQNDADVDGDEPASPMAPSSSPFSASLSPLGKAGGELLSSSLNKTSSEPATSPGRADYDVVDDLKTLMTVGSPSRILKLETSPRKKKNATLPPRSKSSQQTASGSMPSLRPIIPITEDKIVEMSPASSVRSRSLSIRLDYSEELSQEPSSSEEVKVVKPIPSATLDPGSLDMSSLLSKLMAVAEEGDDKQYVERDDSARFYSSETGNDPLDIPGFDLDGVEEEDVLNGTVLIKGLQLQ